MTTPAIYDGPMNVHLARTLAELDRLLAGASPPQLRWKPRPEKWSAAEVLEHLAKTYSSTARLFEKILANGKLRVQPLTLRDRAAQFVVLTLGHMPSGRQAPEMTLPGGAPAEVVARDVRAHLLQMAKLHIQIARRFPGRKIAQHPVLGPLTPEEWAKFHWVHSRHHFRQMEKLTQEP